MIGQLGLALAATLAATGTVRVVAAQSTRLVPVGTGWARSSVNTAMFHTSSVVSRDGVQHTAYYDSAAHVVLARRAVGADRWDVRTTPYTNDVADAHNAIALGVDGRGVLHVAWAEHDRPLHYARAVRAGSLDLTGSLTMTGQRDQRLHLFVQRVGQGDGERLEEVPPQPVSILEWTPSGTRSASSAATRTRALDVAARAALDSAAGRYRRAARALDPTTGYPRSTNPDGSWRSVPLRDWTSGFFPGTLWYLHEYTRDPELRAQAERWTQPLAAITSGSYDHDLGFQYYTSFGNALRITGDARFRAPLLDAAGKLAGRYDPRVGAIRSWSWGEWRYPVIVDNMMNLELLLWGAAHGGEARWRDIARRHADKTLADHVRADGGSFHVVDYDPATGSATRRMTRQGFADSSTWARGQAWAIYGFTMVYRETRDPRYLATARRAVEYVVPRLPADGVPCWDYQAPGCPQSAPRDASAAAIMASALLELSTLTTGDEARRHRATAERMLTALTSPAYLGQGATRQSILVHAVGDLPRGGEVDVGINYADYYFVEALLRYLELRGAANVRVLPRPAMPR